MKKRERADDEGVFPQGKRAAGGPRAESSETAANQTAASGGPRLTCDDALTYLKAVKEQFKDDKEKYDEFLEVMKDFKAQRIDTAGVIGRVKELFKGYRDLILGFNTFLPPGYEITLPLLVEEDLKKQQQQQQPAVEFDQAINYVNKIKARFQTDEQVYKAFLEILNMYRKGNKSINEVYQEVASLFENHGDLLEEFTYFLPGSTGPSIASTPGAHHHHHHPAAKPVHHHNSSRHGDDKSFGARGKQFGEKLVVPKKEKSVAMHGDRDRDRDLERRAEKDRKKDSDKKEAGEKKERGDRDEGGRDKEKDFDSMHRCKRESARRADKLIRKQSQGGEGGEGLPGPGPQVSADDKRGVKGGTNVVQYPFFDKVKARLRSRDTYQEFLKCLNIFSQEIISRAELQSLVSDILGKHADLMEGFNEFLTHCENVEGYLAGVFNSGRKLGDFVEESPLKAVKVEKETDRDRTREKEKERDRGRDRERDRDKDRDVKPHHAVKEASHKVSMVPSKDKHINKPISELDLSNCDRCTPSYRLLPKHYPRPVSTHRTPLGSAVLNDSWVSVTSGSEDYSFKHMRKNQYEESLFRCEDDRFELDMLLESTAVTAKVVGEYADKQGDASAMEEHPNGVDDYLSQINFRCIERIYGDHGLDIIDVLRKNTAKAMPIIHIRLKQKQEEWSKCRTDMNKVWAEVYAKNCYRALDHRSFYFRQQDKKALSTKGLLSEIKEINDKKRREDDTMLAIAAGNRRPLLPDLTFEFSDISVHEDLYQIVKYSSEEICTSSEQIGKIMRIWTTFIEPMFGIPPRAHGAEDMEDAARVPSVKPRGSQAIANCSGGSEGEATPPEAVGSATDLKANVPLEEFATATSNLDDFSVDHIGKRHFATMNGGSEPPSSAGYRISEVTGSVQAGKDTAADVGNVEMPGIVAGSVSVPQADGSLENMLVLQMRPNTGALGVSPRSSGELPNDNAVAQQGNAAAEKAAVEVRFNAAIPESRGIGSRSEDLDSIMEIDGVDVLGRGDREEGELSPSPELEDKHKTKFNSSQGLEENGLMKDFGHDDEDVEGVGGTEMDHDQDADDEGEESAQKSTEDSDNATEAGEEVSGSESGEEQSEHEDDDDEDDEQEGKAESEGEAEGMADADDGDGDGNSSLASPDRSFSLCKPLAAYTGSSEGLVVGSLPRKDGRIFYGNDLFYILFRLHQTLYERILSAKKNAALAAQKKTKDGASPNLYSRFMQVLYSLLDGSVENSKFEDECRAIIGTQSYVLFTLDKLIFKLVKQLQAAASDDAALKLLLLHAYENAGEAVDQVYYANACVLLHDENIYRLEHRSSTSELCIQLMEGGSDKLEVSGHALESSFQSYLDEFFISIPTMRNHRVFMRRNRKKKHASDDENVALQSAMENVRVVNGLEYKISSRTSKVSYVLDTEDIFLRCTPLRSKVNWDEHKLKEVQRQRFGEWVHQRLTLLNDGVSQVNTSQMA